jgi:hypothetical protein
VAFVTEKLARCNTPTETEKINAHRSKNIGYLKFMELYFHTSMA